VLFFVCFARPPVASLSTPLLSECADIIDGEAGVVALSGRIAPLLIDIPEWSAF
jgi:hypothetical protein